MIALLINFLFFSALACEFSPEVKKIYSLSGPLTLALKDLNLMSKPQLKGISVFNPISVDDFKGERLAGGVFLSPASLSVLKGGIVFFDESQELRRILAKYPDIQAIEIITRNLTPQEVEEKIQRVLKPWLKDCPQDMLSQRQAQLQKLKKLIPPQKTFLFFLGEIKGERLPEMLMVNDGVVKWMLEEKLIRSYPSELAYVSWSAKILHNLPDETIKIGITDSAGSMKRSFSRNGQNINLTFPGALVPGKGQVDAMIYLFENLAR